MNETINFSPLLPNICDSNLLEIDHLIYNFDDEDDDDEDNDDGDGSGEGGPNKDEDDNEITSNSTG